MNQTDKPIANPFVALREDFDDYAVLFNPDTAEAVGANPVAVAAWKLMDGRRSVEDIVLEIKNSFEGAPDATSKDVAAFISSLVEKGFVGLELKS